MRSLVCGCRIALGHRFAFRGLASARVELLASMQTETAP
jgi:hypothetical protein